MTDELHIDFDFPIYKRFAVIGRSWGWLITVRYNIVNIIIHFIGLQMIKSERGHLRASEQQLLGTVRRYRIALHYNYNNSITPTTDRDAVKINFKVCELIPILI